MKVSYCVSSLLQEQFYVTGNLTMLQSLSLAQLKKLTIFEEFDDHCVKIVAPTRIPLLLPERVHAASCAAVGALV